MVKRIFSLLIFLLCTGCDTLTGEYEPFVMGPGTEEVVLDVYALVEQDENDYYHYPYLGYNYGSIYFSTSEPMTLVGWTSPDEFCVEHFNDTICEPVINYQTYSDEEGYGQQNFYINESFIGDTLSLVGYINEDVYDIIKVIITTGE